MNDLNWYDYLRAINVIWGVVLIIIVGRSARKVWSTYTDKLKDYTVVLLGMCLLIAGGGLENILQNTEYRNAGFATTILLFFMTRAVRSKETLLKPTPKWVEEEVEDW